MNVLKIAVVAVLSVAAALVVIGVLIVVAVDVFGDSEFLLDDGAVAEFPYGTTWQPNPLPSYDTADEEER